MTASIHRSAARRLRCNSGMGRDRTGLKGTKTRRGAEIRGGPGSAASGGRVTFDLQQFPAFFGFDGGKNAAQGCQKIQIEAPENHLSR